jgi:folylpolyglutamate synthase/dihydropteroate synthase
MEAVNKALSIASEDDVVVITGSFYTIGEVELAGSE